MTLPRGHSVRVIGGKWRRSKIEVLDRPGLRPTGNRIRETLFNWLSPVIAGARCLDLFAGSGALGFEAASRGAAHCTLIEDDREIVAHLRATAARLQATEVEIIHADSFQWLKTNLWANKGANKETFDIIFLDPPFSLEKDKEHTPNEGLLNQMVTLLAETMPLSKNTSIYLESKVDADLTFLPNTWTIERHARAGDVAYSLVRIVDR